MTLREELGRRLVEVFIKSLESQPRPSPSDPNDPQAWIPFGSGPDHFPYMANVSLLPLADECIRQMEWAWLQGQADDSGLGNLDDRTAGTGEWAKWAKPTRGDGWLSAAPEGWKP